MLLSTDLENMWFIKKKDLPPKKGNREINDKDGSARETLHPTAAASHLHTLKTLKSHKKIKHNLDQGGEIARMCKCFCLYFCEYNVCWQ